MASQEKIESHLLAVMIILLFNDKGIALVEHWL
jgi:hypothetical protein